MAEAAPLAGDGTMPYDPATGEQVPPPMPADGAAAAAAFEVDDVLPPPVELQPQVGSSAPRLDEHNLVLIPLCRKGDRVSIERQIQAGASVDEKDIEGNTPLHVAVEAPRNETATVQCLLEMGADINALNDMGAMPLHYVCLRRSNHRGIANILLENGANIDGQTRAGKTPLHFACEQQNPELVEVLCMFLANPSLCDVEGNTPMHLTMLKTGGRDTVKRQIAEHLLERGAVFHSPNLQGMTPLHMASRGGYLRALSVIVERRADPASQTSRGETGLHFACANHQGEVTQLLLQVGPQTINVQDVDGNTPLHMCASVGNSDSALLLLRMGAETTVRNLQKKTALELSKIKGTDINSTHNPELQLILQDAQKSSSCYQS